ncbi:MAG TPA: HPP family protein [Terricaulis sp.]|nr:HPP family protein [Terricaulis sp.]
MTRLNALGPVTAVPAREALRAGLGALIGLSAVATLAWLIAPDLRLGIYLIAPFGATAVLIYAAPNSPLAQPWPAIVGNTVSALSALGICQVITQPLLGVPIAVGVAIMVMALCRATHPPGGAVAMTVVLGFEAIGPLGLSFILLPVAAGTTILVAIAALYARATGRHYPFRQFSDPNPHGTQDHAAPERLGLSEAELTDILSRYRQSLNLGVEDLARLIAAAELTAAGHRVSPQTAEHIMSRDLVTVAPETPLQDIVSMFILHGFTSLPVVDTDDRFVGVIFQLHLIASIQPREASSPQGSLGVLQALGWAPKQRPLYAADIMGAAPLSAKPDTLIAALLPQLAENGVDAVPILDGQRIVGIVTQTDLIAALARETLRAE